MTEFHTQLAYRRRPSRQVAVGKVTVGGTAPLRVQSMLTSNTWDVDAVINETRWLAYEGCEIVRLTVPTQKDLDALPAIRERMAAEGLDVPLVADIHFNPRLALEAVPYVEKVRINPGNYADRKDFLVREYSDAQYAEELERIEQALLPLIGALKEHGRALRVGVNHGSLCDRIVNRFGDTPEGMVESAMEFLRVLGRHGFHDTILSMKSSNPLVVIRAYRLLALAMDGEDMDYPLHLGVTEAGDGPEGRLKSAVGIGALLCDGLGDTVRVSLTEPAVNEIPAARELVEAVQALQKGPQWPETAFVASLAFARRPTRALPAGGVEIGGGAPVAFLALGEGGADPPEPFDGILSLERATPEDQPPVVSILPEAVESPAMGVLLDKAPEFERGGLLVINGERLLYPVRRLVALLDERGLDWPVGVEVPFIEEGALPLGLAAEFGSLAADGLIDVLICPDDRPDSPTAVFCRTLLQAARLRTYQTEYISCPSCGRTLFDLQEITERIKARTRHLKGLKIGIMGCIVNGPGEMADADFGYVGGAPGKINLYKGQECVERGVDAAEAVERLVALIKQHGRWVEP